MMHFCSNTICQIIMNLTNSPLFISYFSNSFIDLVFDVEILIHLLYFRRYSLSSG